jgi:hypothetical protein
LTITFELGARWRYVRDVDAVVLRVRAPGCGRRYLHEPHDENAMRQGDDVVPPDDLLSLHSPIVRPLRAESSLRQTQERLPYWAAWTVSLQ